MLKTNPMDRIDTFSAVNHSFFKEASKVPSPNSGMVLSQWGDRNLKI
jgi:hypothetical protein